MKNCTLRHSRDVKRCSRCTRRLHPRVLKSVNPTEIPEEKRRAEIKHKNLNGETPTMRGEASGMRFAFGEALGGDPCRIRTEFRSAYWHSLSKRLVSTLAVIALAQLGRAQPVINGEFVTVGSIGHNVTSSNSPAALALDAEGNIYIAGTSNPERNIESDLPGADTSGLFGKDIFIARMRPETGKIDWLVRTGTDSEDVAEDMQIDTQRRKLYVVGRTSGTFGATPRKGQHDAFIIKYNIPTSGVPTREWDGPVTFGTSSLDAGTRVVVDSSGQSIYVAGHTRGALFREKSSSDYDAFLVRVRTSDGVIENGVQFGSEENEYARHVSLPTDSKGSILVGCDTSRRIGDVEVTNTRVYKFKASNMSPLGSLLLKTYSRETISGVVRHPLFTNTAFVSGTSWLDELSSFEYAAKRVEGGFDGEADMGDEEVGIDELQEIKPQFSKKFGSRDGKADKSSRAKLDPGSGLLWLGGSTAGLLAQTANRSSNSQIAFIALDPNEAESKLIAQQELPQSDSFSSLADFMFSPDSKFIIYAGSRANGTSGVFFSVIGTLGITPSLRTAVTTPPPLPTPSPSPAAGSESSRASDEVSNNILPIAVGGGVAGIALIAIIICSLCAIRKVQARSETLKHGRTRGQNQREHTVRSEVQQRSKRSQGHAGNHGAGAQSTSPRRGTRSPRNDAQPASPRSGARSPRNDAQPASPRSGARSPRNDRGEQNTRLPPHARVPQMHPGGLY